MTTAACELLWLPVRPGHADEVAVLALNRPQVANAMSESMLAELTAHLHAVAARSSCRVLILRGHGKHFSAGADLAWMQAAAGLDYAGNLRDAAQLTALFEALATLPQPTIAVVQGSAFGGAVGLAAACDVVLALNTSKFCLSEVRLGLAPAVILPYLVRKVQPGALRSWALSGRVVSAEAALGAGLVQRVVREDEVETALREEVDALLAAAPAAQTAIKALLGKVASSGAVQGPHTAAAIAALRVAPAGRAGLAAFFARQVPPWAVSLAPDWTLAPPQPLSPDGGEAHRDPTA